MGSQQIHYLLLTPILFFLKYLLLLRKKLLQYKIVNFELPTLGYELEHESAEERSLPRS